VFIVGKLEAADKQKEEIKNQEEPYSSDKTSAYDG
jgi:hypothetical protein